MPLTLTDLPAGHIFEPIVFTLDAETSRAYRGSVGDEGAIYDVEGFVPPLSIAAIALGSLLNQVGLPPGSLHVSESLECHAAVAVGSLVDCTAKLVQRSKRAGWVVSVLDSQMSVNGAPAVSSRATVMSPAEPA